MSYSQKAINKWQAANTRRISLMLMLKSDADVLAKLDAVPNKTDYIRQLIRRDIAAENLQQPMEKTE